MIRLRPPRLHWLPWSSRGFYLKAAIQAMLPAIEENYWTQQATTYEESIIDREFRTIMDHALRPHDPGLNTA